MGSGAGVLLAGLGATGCGGAAAGSHAAAAASPGDAPYAALGQLGRVLVDIENEYVDPVDRARLVDGAIAGMVSGLDPHSSYMPPDEFAAFQNDTQGEFGGVGIEVETRGGELIVLAPIEGSPAERAGVQSGDVIVGVDAAELGSGTLDKIVKRLRGPAGTRVKLSVRRGSVEHVFDLTREVIHVQSVASKLLVDRVGYVRVKQFQEHTHDELLEAAGSLRAQAGGAPLAGLVLDLRSDPGGLVDQAAEVADELLDEGVIYTTRHRGAIVDEVKARSGGVLAGMPCVVLVDRYTASASELVAGALQDHRRATIVGEPTFGKGSVQAIIALPGGAGMRLTISRYYTPSGRAIQAEGVHPDVAVEAGGGGERGGRERDLEGHLAAESTGAAAAPPARSVVVEGDAGAPATPFTGKVAREVPDDPASGSDAVLKVGWQVLKQAMAR
jgi:carboxyl-terminal processing protease